MSSTFIANTLSLTLLFVSLIIILRSCYLYAHVPSARLFILSLSMAIIALTALASFVSDNITNISLNVNWFIYIGQAVSFLFLFLSLAGNSNRYLHQVKRWQIIISVLLLMLLLAAPILPMDFPAPIITQSILSGSRGLVALFICISYILSFNKKENHFNLLMSVAFFLISAGYFTIIPKYFQANITLDRVGDILRIFGMMILLVAILLGEPSRTPDEEKIQSARVSLNRQRALNSKNVLKKDTKHAKV
jgi:hypothetical protein